MNKDIGNKIKLLRQSNGMTLKTLSEKVGLSIGFFSQLERGLTSVAIDSLSKNRYDLRPGRGNLPGRFFAATSTRRIRVVPSRHSRDMRLFFRVKRLS